MLWTVPITALPRLLFLKVPLQGLATVFLRCFPLPCPHGLGIISGRLKERLAKVLVLWDSLGKGIYGLIIWERITNVCWVPRSSGKKKPYLISRFSVLFYFIFWVCVDYPEKYTLANSNRRYFRGVSISDRCESKTNLTFVGCAEFPLNLALGFLHPTRSVSIPPSKEAPLSTRPYTLIMPPSLC